ncbi:MAG TPA: alanine racemase, partial [Longimicrobiaceae bacterium]|nr:alanine racemase [Longimicrobiaceae bacterium]
MTEPESVQELETPAALVDVDRMHANLRRAAEYTRAHGLAWRPHVKTHKTPELAAEQLRAGAVGVTVATPREAEVMAAVADDVLLAYPPFGASKLARLMALPGRVRLTVGLDSRAAAEGLARAAREAGRTAGVLVEVDAGMGRVGVQAPDDAVALARAARDAGLEFRGV